MLRNVATSYQPKNNVGPTLKCLLGKSILIKAMGIEVAVTNYLRPPKTMFLPQITLKIMI